jgi:histidyl-tRNA synthetase
MTSRLIEPRTLKGFRDYPPALMIPRERLMETARAVYRSYGFAPIDTPALEYAEILLGKGGEETDKQLFRFRDQGERDVALRFDLTVPLARFVAQHHHELGMPFKRYHLAPVWRGETPQKGRFREFMQCDFDTIGTTSNAADIEVALVIHDLFVALGFERFVIRINHRQVLTGLLEDLGLAARGGAVLRALDKLPKVGRDAVLAELAAHGVGHGAGERILDLVLSEGASAMILEQTAARIGHNATAAAGIAKLRELIQVAAEAGVPEGRLELDLSIARGLDYYTGTVYETFLTDLPGIGSVCSGGRYDNLAGLYTRQQFPGVGASLGLDRLLAAMEELRLLPKVATPAPVFLVQFGAEFLGRYEKTARDLRAAGIGVELYPEAKKLGAQLGYADKRGFRLALIAGPDELAKAVWQVKDLAKKESREVADRDLIETVRTMLLEVPKQG